MPTVDKKKRSKLESLYPERELQFGDLVVRVRAVPGLRAPDLMEYFQLAAQTFTGQEWSALHSSVWPKIAGLITSCVEFVDEPDITFEDLPLGPLGEIVQAIRDLTFDGDAGNPTALPQAIGKVYGLMLRESPVETPEVPTSSEITSPTSA